MKWFRRLIILIFALGSAGWLLFINAQIWGDYFALVQSRGLLLKHKSIKYFGGWDYVWDIDVIVMLDDYAHKDATLLSQQKSTAVPILAHPGIGLVVDETREMHWSELLLDRGILLRMPEWDALRLIPHRMRGLSVYDPYAVEDFKQRIPGLIDALAQQKSLRNVHWFEDVDAVDFRPLDVLSLESMTFSLVRKSEEPFMGSMGPSEIEVWSRLPSARVLKMDAEYSIERYVDFEKSDFDRSSLSFLDKNILTLRLEISPVSQELHLLHLPQYQEIYVILRDRAAGRQQPLKVFVNARDMKSNQRIALVHESMVLINQDTGEVLEQDDDIWLNEWTGEGLRLPVKIERQPVLWEGVGYEYWLDLIEE